MDPVRAVYDDLGGGLNEGENPVHIADREFVLLDNFTPIGRRLLRRNGVYVKTPTAWTELLTGLFFFRDGSGTIYPIFGTPEGFARYAGGDTGIIIDIPYQAPIVTRFPQILYDLHPWVFVQMNGVGYAMRANTAGLIRVTAATWSYAGIDAPSAAATIAANATGDMTGGDREVVYTFRNSVTGAESNYSPVSNLITLNDDESVDVSGVAISSNPQVNQRRLYITAPGTAGVYLWAGDIDDNTTTTANINKVVSELGHLASRNNGAPPDDLEVGDIFLDSYLVASDGVDVFISEPFKPESFSEFNIFDVFKNDGHRVRAVRSMGDRVFIGKTNKVHYFTRNGQNWNRDTLSEDHGCYAHHSMQVAEGWLIWYTGTDVVRSDGHSVYPVGTPRIRKLLARIPPNRKEFVTAAVYPKYGLYIMSCCVDPEYLENPTDTIDDGTIPQDRNDTRNNVMIVYNYRTNAWATWTTQSMKAPMLPVMGWDNDLHPSLYALFYDSRYHQLDRGVNDFGTAIRARFRTKAYRFTPIGLLSAIRRVFLKLNFPEFNPGRINAPGQLALRLYRDESSTAIKERTGLTVEDIGMVPIDRLLKGYNLASGQKGATWQLEAEYTSSLAIEIEAIAFEAIPRAERVKMR